MGEDVSNDTFSFCYNRDFDILIASDSFLRLINGSDQEISVEGEGGTRP